jgi:hypothetical protein
MPSNSYPFENGKGKEAGEVETLLTPFILITPREGRGRELTAVKVVKEIFFSVLSISRTALHCLKFPRIHSRIFLTPAARYLVALSTTNSHGLARDRTRFSAVKSRHRQGTAYLMHYIA